MTHALARLLIVDDEPQILRFLKAVLVASGYAVDSAKTGGEAVRLALALAPEVVLLDLGLPDISGHEVLARLCGAGAASVIILSGRENEWEKIAALDNGAEDYITKPFDVGELLARIRVALRHRRRKQGLADILRFPGLDIDLAQRVVRVDGGYVKLTPKEWTLLTLLAGNAGRVLTHRQLLTSVWGPAQAESAQYLRIYVATLRGKLGAAGRLIRTENGVGYRMAETEERPVKRASPAILDEQQMPEAPHPVSLDTTPQAAADATAARTTAEGCESRHRTEDSR